MFGRKKEPAPTPRAWDYRKGRWGWSVNLLNTPDEGRTWSAVGWGTGLRQGDFVVLAGKRYREGDTNSGVAYRLTAFHYYENPPDMWAATLVYDPEHCPELTPQSMDQIFPPHWDRYGEDYPFSLMEG